ncbi:hypothetical protein A3F06_03575 [candidate division TM6 bacterium RIFCSPHIGHO2_12_FULL_36_22]|nr:MAG: hypothetical protein A3F06_03575 [candidate division TM6 bacterium RIFCSPHIGHO2_12_FULL_36_22]
MKQFLILFALLAISIDAQIISSTIPLSFYNRRSYLGFVQDETGLWGGLPNETYGKQEACPRFYNLIGDYSFSLVPRQYGLEIQARREQQFVWVDVQWLFNALFRNKRLVKLRDGSQILLSNQVFNALRTQISIERLQQLLPSYGGVCIVDVCCKK